MNTMRNHGLPWGSSRSFASISKVSTASKRSLTRSGFTSTNLWLSAGACFSECGEHLQIPLGMWILKPEIRIGSSQGPSSLTRRASDNPGFANLGLTLRFQKGFTSYPADFRDSARRLRLVPLGEVLPQLLDVRVGWGALEALEAVRQAQKASREGKPCNAGACGLWGEESH